MLAIHLLFVNSFKPFPVVHLIFKRNSLFVVVFNFFISACRWTLATTRTNNGLLCSACCLFHSGRVYLCLTQCPPESIHTAKFTKNFIASHKVPQPVNRVRFLCFCGCPLMFCITSFAVCTKFLFNMFFCLFACAFLFCGQFL